MACGSWSDGMCDLTRTTLTALTLWLGVLCAGALPPAAAAAQPDPAAAAAEGQAVATPPDASEVAPPASEAGAAPVDATPVDAPPGDATPRDAAIADAEAAAKADAASADDATGGAAPASDTVTRLADWIRASDDTHGLPFVIIDKVAAEVFVFDDGGHLQGAAPALIGLARGDDSAPGIGDRPLSAIGPDERTTPAGRFLGGLGSAKGQYRVFWVDYALAISIHPVVTGNPKEQRRKRLKSPDPDDRRITYGCINVSFAFYDKVVRPTFTGTPGVVYILPETLPADEVFPGLRHPAPADAAPPREAVATPDLGSSQAATASDAVSTAGADASVVR